MLYWEGTFGYGDMVGGITNCLWRQLVFSDNEINFNWYTDRKFYPPNKKYDVNDPETTLERLYKIKDQFCDVDKIKITHTDIIHEENKKRKRYINRFKTDQWWSTLWKTKIVPCDRSKIVIWHPFDNIDDLSKDHGTQYKSPLNKNQWDEVINILNKTNYNLVYVNYRQSVDYVFQEISEATLCIGYEGLGQLISKNFWKPIITYSNLKEISNVTSGPWSMIDNKVNKKLYSIDSIIEEQLEKINYCKKIYEDRQSSYRS